MRYQATLAAVILCCFCLATPALAGRQRNRVDTLASVTHDVFLPSAAAPDQLSTTVLSGLDYTAIAPPGQRLRVIEDEPYLRIMGQPGQGQSQLWSTGISSILLRGDNAEGGWYEARISLRVGAEQAYSQLLSSFDTASHFAYGRNLVFPEDRGEVMYSLNEIRSPLGLTDPECRLCCWREYLAYTAAVLNPLGWDKAEVAELPDTPYQFLSGELRAMRLVAKELYMVTIEFEASEFPYSLGLTENIARCVINRLQADQRLDYLAYFPEYELALPWIDDEAIDPRTADLAERPGEGCGMEPLPINGDICPVCQGDGLRWPAVPYQDAANRYKLPAMNNWPRCSHCLLTPFDEVDWNGYKHEHPYSCNAPTDACAPCQPCGRYDRD